MKLVAVILTLNEARHLARCLSSLKKVVDDVLIADCFSTDDTVDIAKAHGARVIQRPWISHAAQFNWALTQLEPDIDWVLRIDADEVLTPDLAKEIKRKLSNLSPEVDGVFVGRRIIFQGQLMRHGGLFPVRVLRLFRLGRGECENRWMDEHIKVTGRTAEFQGDVIDENLNSLTWWTEKHNQYASREAVDLLNLEYNFMPHDTIAKLSGGSASAVRRWFKERFYVRLPAGFRAIGYFFYRYVLRLGFLDGATGFSFHFLQGFWYRYLVDAKIAEVRRYIEKENVEIDIAIQKVLGVNIRRP